MNIWLMFDLCMRTSAASPIMTMFQARKICNLMHGWWILVLGAALKIYGLTQRQCNLLTTDSVMSIACPAPGSCSISNFELQLASYRLLQALADCWSRYCTCHVADTVAMARHSQQGLHGALMLQCLPAGPFRQLSSHCQRYRSYGPRIVVCSQM